MPRKEELKQKLYKLIDVDKCQDVNYKRNVVPKELREKIIEEQMGMCFLCTCGTSIPIVHHIKPDGENVRENLVILCPLCHKWIHWILKKYFGYRGSIEPWRKYG